PNTLMIVNLISPDGRYDGTFLSNYATIYIKDELGRLPGVAGITYLGQRDYSLRAWLDPDKMAALNLHAMDVVAAIAQQNVQVAAGQVGQPPTAKAQQFQLTINTQGRLADPQQFADVIVKAGTTAAGQMPQAMPGQSGASGQLGTKVQATPIVKLRDVVRENKYFVRIQLDPTKLASRKLTPGQVTDLLKPAPLDIVPEGDADPEDESTMTWLATYGGGQPPHMDELANTLVVLGGPHTCRLADLVVKKRGIERLLTQSEEGVQLGSQQHDPSCTL